MATIKISEGPRYQKTGSPSQKKARKLAEIMSLVIKDALSCGEQRVRNQTERKDVLRERA